VLAVGTVVGWWSLRLTTLHCISGTQNPEP
jgi:hypothetical protein